MLKLIALLLLAALAGCVSVAPPKSVSGDGPAQSALQAKLTIDLTQAIADNAKATDSRAGIRLKCWQTLLDLVPQAPSLPGGIAYDAPNAGAFDSIERAGAFIENAEELADYQIPDATLVAIELGCGPVALRARGLRDKFAIRFVRFGARVGILPIK